jgi:hypothetical protein
MQFTRQIFKEMRRACHAMRLVPEFKAGVFDYQSASPISRVDLAQTKKGGNPRPFSHRGGGHAL